MASQDMAEVVPLFGEEKSLRPDIEVIWTPAGQPDPGLYRRVLEHLFLHEDQNEAEAA